MARFEKLGWDPASIALGFARGIGLTSREAMAFAAKVAWSRWSSSPGVRRWRSSD